MNELEDAISKAGKKEIESIFRAVLKRYGELFPDWEMNVISLHRCEDRDVQLERIIDILHKLKASP